MSKVTLELVIAATRQERARMTSRLRMAVDLPALILAASVAALSGAQGAARRAASLKLLCVMLTICRPIASRMGRLSVIEAAAFFRPGVIVLRIEREMGAGDGSPALQMLKSLTVFPGFRHFNVDEIGKRNARV